MVLSQSEMDLVVCFGSLCYCTTQVNLGFSSQTGSWKISFRIFCCEAAFLDPSVRNSPALKEIKQRETARLPPYLTVGMMIMTSDHWLFSQMFWRLLRFFLFLLFWIVWDGSCILSGQQLFLPSNYCYILFSNLG